MIVRAIAVRSHLRACLFRELPAADPSSFSSRELLSHWATFFCPRPPLRPKRSALRAPEGCAEAEANDLIQLRQKLKREEQEETKYEKDKTQKGDTSNRIRMGTFLIGLDTAAQPRNPAAKSCLTSRRQYVTSITRMFSCSRVRGGKTLCLPRRSWCEAKRRELSSSPATTATNTNEGRRPPHVA